jgi:hypothetical protein
MSMDFVYDLKEKLEEQKMEYAICVIKPLKNGDTKVEFFYNVEHDDSYASMCDAFNVVCGGDPPENIDIEYDSYEDPEQTPTPEKLGE